MVEGEKKKKKKAAQQYPPFWLHEQSLFTVLYTYILIILCVSVCTIYIISLSLALSFEAKGMLWTCGAGVNRRPKNFSLSQKIARNPSTHQSTQPQWVSGCTGIFMIVIARPWMCMIHILRGRSTHFVPRWPLLLKNYSKLLVRQDMTRLTSVETTWADNDTLRQRAFCRAQLSRSCGSPQLSQLGALLAS